MRMLLYTQYRKPLTHQSTLHRLYNTLSMTENKSSGAQVFWSRKQDSATATEQDGVEAEQNVVSGSLNDWNKITIKCETNNSNANNAHKNGISIIHMCVYEETVSERGRMRGKIH